MKSVHIVGKTLPECWENAVMACWEQGESFPTQYDKPNDPNSRDITLMMHVKEPFAEPRIHRCFPGSLEDLEKYRNEVLLGAHDHWVNPEDGKWEYTYSERIFKYNLKTYNNFVNFPKQFDKYSIKIFEIDQIEKCIELLKKCGHTRRAQAVTWKVWEDLGIHDPACLQRLWFRVEKNVCPECFGNKEDGLSFCWKCRGIGYIEKLNMNVHMRSNDGYKAAFFNSYAFTELQKYVADRVGVSVGEYIHIADSFHIYGSYFEEFNGFLNTVKNRSFEDRVWDTSFAIEMFIEGCDTLLNEPDMPPDKKIKIEGRKKELQSMLK